NAINKNNVERLGLAWEHNMASMRGLEATPIVIDGVMYVSSTWSRVSALNAKTGKLLWTYDPQVPRSWAGKVCCDIVNRGVAVAAGMVVFGTLDGRLIALNADDGKATWEVDTLPDKEQWYSITGAPRIVGNRVFIGNGGAEYSVRGYVSAYDLQKGSLLWRFYTVPDSVEGPFENSALEKAATTWSKDSSLSGAGGTVWDSMAFDPDLNLLYVGTGNGSPWPKYKRSPGGGDNLFLASILALKPETGELVWHYQTTPGETWDFTATQHMILADLEILGQTRKVLMQAPKNGFFYVLDRQSGELLSAQNYVHVNWASHIDMTTGKPVETGLADYEKQDRYVFPSPAGAHNWQPMSFSPNTGLVYFTARDIGWVHSMAEDKWFTYGEDNLQALIGKQSVPKTSGYLKAWNPQQQRLEWEIAIPNIWNGGVLSTDGGLVAFGTAMGDLQLVDARSGTLLKTIETGTGIIAPPISYAIDEEQYIAVLAGWGGPAFNTLQGNEALLEYENRGRLMVFKLDGKAVDLPPALAPRGAFPEPPTINARAEVIEQGRQLYVLHCGACHGVYESIPMLPDLRRMNNATHQLFDNIVLDGIYQAKGMPSFSDVLSKDDSFAIRAHIIERTEKARSLPVTPTAN
ncbi:MAG: PQQ-dependent dehydrogenase, methanol/ethanol family, partial [Pseudomonadales bacterium]